MNKLTHIGEDNRPQMVDVSDKKISYRTAIAGGFIRLDSETLKLIQENKMKKGNVLITAELAGTQASKKTSDLIPLCHNLPLSKAGVKAEIQKNGIKVTAEAKCTGQTGVEMEALTAVSIALLTIYDMCKAVDKSMIIENIHLIEKHKKEVTE